MIDKQAVNSNWDIVILGGVRDFHAMDWYRAVCRVCPNRKVNFVTDSIESEGLKNLAEKNDNVTSLAIVDWWLFKSSSKIGNIWRNFIKVVFMPMQVIRLRALYLKHNFTIVHAHPMYYMLLCFYARIPYIGTPQGDELLIRPSKSFFYKYFASIALRGAQGVVVDSMQMKNAAKRISNVDAHLIQNGVNVKSIKLISKSNNKRFRVSSIRGVEELYRIAEIVEHRNKYFARLNLTLLYPFQDSRYYTVVKKSLNLNDERLGRLDKEKMYRVFYESLLVISIPKSDSSPRSVYEAIFAGCCVATVYNPWIELLPKCMRSRIYIVDLDNKSWLEEAVNFSKGKVVSVFKPSKEALTLFDEDSSIRQVVERLY